MFYSEDEISKDLICPSCKEKYVVPRILPCGSIICDRCVKKIQPIENTNQFKCDQCNEMHNIPPNGFSICEPLIKMLNRKPSKIYRGSQVEDLEKNLKRIENQLKKLEIDLNHGEDVIKDHCSELRRKVQLATDRKIEQINEYNKEMFEQIDEFRRDCLKTFNSVNKQEFAFRLKDMKEFCSNWRNYLASSKIDDLEVEAANEKSKEFISRLVIEDQNLQCLLFNDHCLDYRKNKNESDLDLLDGKMVVKSYDSLYYSQWQKYDLSEMFYEELYKDLKSGYDGVITVKGGGFLDNGNFIIAAEFSKQNAFDLLLMVFDKGKTFKISTKIIQGFFYNFIVMDNKSCLIHGAASTHKAYLTIYNESLERINQVETESLALLSASNSFIFCRSGIETENPLIVYNWSGQVIKKLGQRVNPNEPFYFANVVQLVSKDLKFYFLDEEDGINYLKVMDEISGKLLNKVEKVCDWILFDSNKNLLLINEELTYASPRGELIKNVKLVNFPHGAKNLWG